MKQHPTDEAIAYAREVSLPASLNARSLFAIAVAIRELEKTLIRLHEETPEHRDRVPIYYVQGARPEDLEIEEVDDGAD